jgi:hypothetical protein
MAVALAIADPSLGCDAVIDVGYLDARQVND